MADEPIDQRSRRRLFGRRRVESVDETQDLAPGAATGNTAAVVEEPPDVPSDVAPVDETDVSGAPPIEQASEAEEPPESEETQESQPGGEDEEAMVTANPPVPDIAAPTGAEIATEPSEELEELRDETSDAEVEERTVIVEPVMPPVETPGVASGEAAGELPLPRVIAIANQKGGVGKTTTAVNLGAALAEAGFRVLVVDLDPQGNASTGLGINPRDVESSVYDVIMTDVPALDCVEPTSLKNLFVLPATIDLAGAEIELVSAFSRELKLRRALDAVRPEYDIILIDCPPSLGLLTVNGLAAADDVIVPVQSEYYALEGLGQLLKNVAMVRSLNPTLDVRGIVLTMHDSRTKLAEQVETEVREHFGARVYKTVVPRTVRLSEAPSFGQPIIVFDPTSRGATAYRELAKEVSNGATRRSR